MRASLSLPNLWSCAGTRAAHTSARFCNRRHTPFPRNPTEPHSRGRPVRDDIFTRNKSKARNERRKNTDSSRSAQTSSPVLFYPCSSCHPSPPCLGFTGSLQVNGVLTSVTICNARHSIKFLLGDRASRQLWILTVFVCVCVCWHWPFYSRHWRY